MALEWRISLALYQDGKELTAARQELPFSDSFVTGRHPGHIGEVIQKWAKERKTKALPKFGKKRR